MSQASPLLTRHPADPPRGQVAPASPAAVRLTRPGWRDPRLLLGLVLISVSVALGSWVVGTAARTTPVWAAREAIVPGTELEAEDLEVREVRLGAAAETYLPVEGDAPTGLVVTRVVGAGELLPRAAVVEGAALDLRPVPVAPTGALPSGLEAGATVDLWHLPEASPAGTASGTGGAPPAPRQLAAGLTVAEVSRPTGTFAVGSGVTVQVLVPVEDLPDVLAARSAPGSVEVVLVPGGGS